MELLAIGSRCYYEYDDQVYVVDAKRNERKYMRCQRKYCPGRIVYEAERGVLVSKGHSHDADLLSLQILRKKNFLKKQAANNLSPYYKIYQMAVEMFPEAAEFYSYNAAYYMLRRSRMGNVPRNPVSVMDIGTIFNDPQWLAWKMDVNGRDLFFRGCGLAIDGSVVALFLSEGNAGMLQKNGAMLLVDGTFKTVPKVEGAYQLVTMHVVDDADGQHPTAYPCAFALMTNKTKDAYDKFFGMLSDEVGVMNPQSAMCDFEDALRSSLREAFYGIEVVSCWFHFAQAVHRHAAKVGLISLLKTNENAKSALRQMMALPLLPAHQIAEAYLSIVLFLGNVGLQGRFRQHLSYMRRQWFGAVRPIDYSVFRQPMRTNNAAERLHLTYLESVGTHPNFWVFYRALRMLSATQRSKRNQFANGLKVRQPLKRKYKILNERIERLWNRIDHPEPGVPPLAPAQAIAQAGHFLQTLQGLLAP